MQFEIMENGNLRIFLDESDDKEELQYKLDEYGEIRFLSELLELTGWQGNGKLFEVNPISVGAMTEAPMLSDDVRLSYIDSKDNAGENVLCHVWWFPDYMVQSWPELLIEFGSVVFKKAE